MSQIPIVQFGTSRFLQAHVDLFVSQALEQEEALGKICVVQSSGDPERAKRLAALADPEGYPVRVQGVSSGELVSNSYNVTSVGVCLSTASDLGQISELIVNDAQIILSNTGDAGWAPNPRDHDSAFHQDMSYPAKLTHLLFDRYRSNRAPIQIMPTELVAQNGTALRGLVMPLARALSPDFAKWVEMDVRFVNSLVDRIVSEPIEPAGAVAEPYALWAIEDCEGLVLPCKHPAVKVVKSLEQTETLKLFILNLGHTYLVENWQKQGRKSGEFVRDLLDQPDIVQDLRDLYLSEVLPGFAGAGWRQEALDYIDTTMDRFANPYLDHKLSDIAGNHPQKVARRISAFLDWSERQKADAPTPRLSAIQRSYLDENAQ